MHRKHCRQLLECVHLFVCETHSYALSPQMVFSLCFCLVSFVHQFWLFISSTESWRPKYNICPHIRSYFHITFWTKWQIEFSVQYKSHENRLQNFRPHSPPLPHYVWKMRAFENEHCAKCALMKVLLLHRTMINPIPSIHLSIWISLWASAHTHGPKLERVNFHGASSHHTKFFEIISRAF